MLPTTSHQLNNIYGKNAMVFSMSSSKNNLPFPSKCPLPLLSVQRAEQKKERKREIEKARERERMKQRERERRVKCLDLGPAQALPHGERQNGVVASSNA